MSLNRPGSQYAPCICVSHLQKLPELQPRPSRSLKGDAAEVTVVRAAPPSLNSQMKGLKAEVRSEPRTTVDRAGPPSGLVSNRIRL